MRWLDGVTDSINEFEQTLGDSDGQRRCCMQFMWWQSQTRLNYLLNNQYQHL